VIRSIPIVVAIALLSVSCSPKRVVFMHQSARVNYLITPEEIKDMQFYLGRDMLLNEVPGDGALLVKQGTPGVANAVGPDWIRVVFEEGGVGVPFVAISPSGIGTPYAIATELPDGGLQPLRARNDENLQVGDRTFRVIYGSDALLLVRRKDLEKVEDSRISVKGVKQ